MDKYLASCNSDIILEQVNTDPFLKNLIFNVDSVYLLSSKTRNFQEVGYLV